VYEEQGLPKQALKRSLDISTRLVGEDSTS
jgi:hypothetical protein